MTASPVTTSDADCRDCYRCLRECAVKAIDVADGHASIRPERCILCGHCVNVCPVNAKRVRDDLGRAQSLLLRKERVFVSLAPSFVSEYAGASPYAVVAAIERLGFAGVSETALGAERVAAYEQQAVRDGDGRLRISSACPAVVELVHTYYPGLAHTISDALSPALTHARMLKEWYGDDIGVVFVSPCIAKKKEADDHPDLIDVAITFEDLCAWFDQASISLDCLDDTGAAFVPFRASRAASFPLEGGFLANVAASTTATGGESIRPGQAPAALSASGLADVRAILDELQTDPPAQPLLLELLACRGGCINGPRHRRSTGRIRSMDAVRRWTRDGELPPGVQLPSATIARATGSCGRVSPPVTVRQHDETALRTALATIGKHQRTDELNCGSCGYGTCRDFAAALLEGRAEQTMCMGHMRKVAQNKSDALLRAMPSGVVLVGSDLSIRECNEQFARLAGEEPALLYEAKPGLEGMRLEDILSFAARFEQVFASGEDIVDADFTHDGRILSGSIFVIESGALVGGVFQDVTVPAVQRDRVIARAEEVIRRNLATVQQIAHLMGENAAETEALLTSVIDAFGSAPDGSSEPCPPVPCPPASRERV